MKRTIQTSKAALEIMQLFNDKCEDSLKINAVSLAVQENSDQYYFIEKFLEGNICYEYVQDFCRKFYQKSCAKAGLSCLSISLS